MSGSDLPEQSPGLRVLAVIPARLASSRLPRKVLRDVAGKPLLAWVYEAAAAFSGFDGIVIAADSAEVADLCRQNGWPWRMTSPALPSGTDRLYAISKETPAEIYVNVQGDEPLLHSAHFAALLAPFADVAVDATTLKVPCPPTEIHDPNVVKVVTGVDGRALYFSRAAIPFDRDRTSRLPHWKHLGLYAYRRAALQRFAALPPGALEGIERLEQLRLLENGLALHVAEAPEDALGVNTEEELRNVEAVLRARQAALGR